MNMHKNQGNEPLPDSFFQKILQICTLQRSKKDDFVMHEGEKGDKFYIIIKGSVAFYKNNAEMT